MLTNQKQELPVVNLHRGHSIDASCQVSVNLTMQFQRRFLKIGQSETRIACGGPRLLTDRDEMSNLHRGHSIDASRQVSLNLTKQFQRRRFKKIGQSETRIACGGPCLVMEHNKMCTL